MLSKKKSKRLRKMLLYIEYVTLCLKIELGFQKENPVEEDRMLKWFAFEHLPEKFQLASKPGDQPYQSNCESDGAARYSRESPFG